MASSAFADYVAPARRHPALWRLLLGLLVAAATFLACNLLLFGVLLRTALGEDAVAVFQSGAGPSTPAATMILLASFAGMALAAVAAAAMHRRGMQSLVGPALRRTAADFGLAVAVVAAAYVPAIAVWSLIFDSRPGLDPGLWLRLLPFTLAGLLLQTGAEELLFRGYLTQQLAARFRAPLVWVGLPALGFGLLHFNPAAGAAGAWVGVAAGVLFGLVATDLTVRAGNLGPAWGFHFANNVAAIALLSTEGTITGVALRLTPYGLDDSRLLVPMMGADLAIMALAWLILRRRLRDRRPGP